MSTTTRKAERGPVVVTAEVERALTQVARSILRLEVPRHALPEGASLDRAGYWLLFRISSSAPVRLSELADSVALDLSTVSRQMSHLVSAGLVVREPDPDDGRACLLSLSELGWTVLEAVSEARRQVLAEAVDDWSEAQRRSLAAGLVRLAAGLEDVRGGHRGVES